MRPAAALLVSLLSGNLTACALDQPPQMDETVQAIEESPDPGGDPSANAGSIPPTNPKGGESLPGSENDPQSSAAYPANSVQLNHGKTSDRVK